MTSKNNIRFKNLLLSLLILFCFVSANAKPKKSTTKPTRTNFKKDSIWTKVIPFDIDTPIENKDTDGLIWFAKQQLGTPYKYASADPSKGGLDCSGFLYYVFNHFKIKVPRSSKDYMNYGKTISKNEAKTGDVIVFTGTNASNRIGGHVGIVLENNNGTISFIHSSSGKKNGVTISTLKEGYYQQRFLKIVRVIN